MQLFSVLAHAPPPPLPFRSAQLPVNVQLLSVLKDTPPPASSTAIIISEADRASI